MPASVPAALDHVTDAQVREVLHRAGSKSAAARELGVTRNALAWRLAQMATATGDAILPTQTAVITAAQNNSQIHPVFWAGIRAVVEDLGADLHVIPFRYRNPSAMNSNEPIWFDDMAIGSFLTETRDIGPVQVVGDMKIQATAVNPVAGLQTMTHGRPTIIGHSQIQLESVARPQDHPPVWLHSTGAATLPNFSQDTRQGRLAEHFHSLGAVVVQCVGQTWWMWQVIANSQGHFTFHETTYKGARRSKAAPMEALALGDSHVAQMDQSVHEATFGARGIVEVLKPRRGYLHDVFDGLSISHHDAKDPLKTFWKQRDGVTCARDELILTAKFVQQAAKRFDELYIVPSNHNEWIDRFLNAPKPAQNEEIWFELNGLLRKDANRNKSAFQVWCEANAKGIDNVVFLPRGESHLVQGVDYGSHGDEGLNGGRATARSLSRVALKGTQGHRHAPSIEKGLSTAGMSSDLMDYVRGLTNCDQSHVGQYTTGKRTQLPIRRGKWRP